MAVHHADAAIRNRGTARSRLSRAVNAEIDVDPVFIEVERAGTKELFGPPATPSANFAYRSGSRSNHRISGPPPRPFCLALDDGRSCEFQAGPSNADAVLYGAFSLKDVVKEELPRHYQDLSRGMTLLHK